MSRRPFRVGRARTGLGLFATRLIKKRSRIAEYKGPLLTGKKAEQAEASGNKYLYEVNSRWTIDGKARSNLARYGNHSCNPNAESYNVKRRVFIRAMRNIKPGEEILYDYGIDYLRNVIGIANCQCNRCRKRRSRLAAEAREKRKRKAARLARAAAKASGLVASVSTKPVSPKRATAKAKTAARTTKSRAKTKAKAKTRTKRSKPARSTRNAKQS